MIENRMVVDSQWEEVEDNVGCVSESESGYRHFKTNEFVPEEDAYEYALEKCMNGTEEEQEEFKAMLVEWFFSGNWVKED